MNKKTVITCLIIGCIIIAYAILSGWDHKIKIDNQQAVGEQQIKNAGFELVDAEFNSPNVYIKVHNYTELIEKGKDVNATICFKTYPYTYTVVDSNFSYAWRYTQNYGATLPYLVIAMLGAFFIMATLFTYIFE